MTPFTRSLRDRAAALGGRVALPESTDPRILRAASALQTAGICEVVLVGDEESVLLAASEADVKLPAGLHLVDPSGSSDLDRYASHLYGRRKHKGLAEADAAGLVAQPLWHAAAMLAHGQVDACVAGAVHTTGDVLRAGLQTVGLNPSSSVVSGAFMMSWDDGRVYAYADSAVTPYPDAGQLAHIALDTARMYSQLTGIEARVAFLSFATKGSAAHERVSLVEEACAQAKTAAPLLLIDGPLQFDAAVIESVGQRKAPGSPVAGHANVFMFPNLDAGNIAYKITERLAGAKATGPIVQGLAKPMNDLSRGASVDDVIDTVCAALLMSAKNGG